MNEKEQIVNDMSLVIEALEQAQAATLEAVKKAEAATDAGQATEYVVGKAIKAGTAAIDQTLQARGFKRRKQIAEPLEAAGGDLQGVDSHLRWAVRTAAESLEQARAAHNAVKAALRAARKASRG